jgi:N-formylglutamate amidohydrolase
LVSGLFRERAEISKDVVIAAGSILLDLHAFMAPSDNDICLGNLKGRSSKADTLDALYRLCIGEGFITALNEPFAGAYILRRHHRASVEAIQIELRYSNYMDCSNIDAPGRPELDEAMLKILRPRLQKIVASLSAQRKMSPSRGDRGRIL